MFCTSHSISKLISGRVGRPGNAALIRPSCRPWRWEQSQNALQAYVAFFGLLTLGQIPLLKNLRYAELPYFVGLACLTIYIGAHRGLTNKVSEV